MRILVTGGAGFIGSHIVEHFQGKAEVRVLDNLRSGHLENLKGFEVDFRMGDICDRKAVDEAMEGVDYVFHLAAHIYVVEVCISYVNIDRYAIIFLLYMPICALYQRIDP